MSELVQYRTQRGCGCGWFEDSSGIVHSVTTCPRCIRKLLVSLDDVDSQTNMFEVDNRVSMSGLGSSIEASVDLPSDGLPF